MSSVPPLIAGMTRSMKAMAEQQRVIAENVANSETPGYKARTVTAPDFSALVQHYGGAAGSPGVARPTVEISAAMSALGASAPQAGSRVVLDSATSETKPDGNNVTLEDQLLALGQVQTDFTAATNIYKKQMGLMRLALGRG
ncbi:flagellar biosynthesis protein FlgB [Novosphingobium sp. YJ-S2-02]|uniref:Flagellar biosynthesis protein FlgB n=1 Tax=Novosphingobium aureum TaxID=2792964 RepID=A0A931HA09_9SPHN|nr:flagellar basal body protein [Novosphingobium aureum]MBH0111934.1 flagellar biosynthesis protein FlgB [Novosphingobium aureum]